MKTIRNNIYYIPRNKLQNKIFNSYEDIAKHYANKIGNRCSNLWLNLMHNQRMANQFWFNNETNKS